MFNIISKRIQEKNEIPIIKNNYSECKLLRVLVLKKTWIIYLFVEITQEQFTIAPDTSANLRFLLVLSTLF